MKVWRPALAVAILAAVGLGLLFAFLPQPDVPVAAEALLALIAFVLAATMLLASWRLAFRSNELKRQQRLISGAFALLAFLPIWICTQIIWQSIHHSSGGYPVWFWIVLAAGAVIAIIWVAVPLLLGLIRAIGVALVVVAIVCIGWFGPVLAAGSSVSVTHRTGTSTASSPLPSPTPLTCLWKMLPPPDNGNLIESGVPAIESAVNDAQSKEAAQQWLTKLQVYPGVLAYVANPVLHEQVNPSTLVTNGCATQAASTLVEQMQSAIAEAQVTPATLPASGTNTTTQGNQVVPYGYSNGSGQKAIKIVLPDGTTIYIEAKCGNVVTPGPPPCVTPTPTPIATPTSTPTPSRTCTPKPKPTPCPVCTSPSQVTIPVQDQNPTPTPASTPTPGVPTVPPSPPTQTPDPSPPPSPSGTPNPGPGGGGTSGPDPTPPPV